MVAEDYRSVTEIAGEWISEEQLTRLIHRYHWAVPHLEGKDVVEVACGTGPGLGIIQRYARSLQAGDLSPEILAITRSHYGTRVPLSEFDAQNMPFADGSADVVLLFEAIYYLPNPQEFVLECRRVLRPGGVVLISTANKDLFDFNPSQYSRAYFGVVELRALFLNEGFKTTHYGYMSFEEVSKLQRILRPFKALARFLGLIPKSAKGKRWVKRVVFGKMTRMPKEIFSFPPSFDLPREIEGNKPDREHKVLYCAAEVVSGD